MHMLVYLNGKEKRGEVLAEEEKASKMCDGAIRDMGFRYAMSGEKMVTEMDRWMDMCVEEVEKLKVKDKDEEREVKRMFWGDFPAQSKNT